MTFVEIPLLGSEEVIEVDCNDLPENVDEVLTILRNEKAQLSLWITLALEYYRNGKTDAFVKLLEAAKTESNMQYETAQQDQVFTFDAFKVMSLLYV
jgi:RNA polymerase-associated protein CTR9